MKEVAIDNDFVMHLAEIDWPLSVLENNVRLYFSGMEVSPAMHELVYMYELKKGAETKEKPRAMSLFKSDIIQIKEIESFLETDAKKKFYEIVFKEIYRDFKGAIPEGINDILKDWKSQASFGETHTVTMCFILDCDIFLSDDGDSKRLAKILESKRAFSINVYNRGEAMEALKKDFSKLNKHDRRAIKHTR